MLEPAPSEGAGSAVHPSAAPQVRTVGSSAAVRANGSSVDGVAVATRNHI